MKILLTAINAKYIHSNLAVYSLKAYAKQYRAYIQISEYTINHEVDYMIQEIYKQNPDVVAFSCYIWNIEIVKIVTKELHKILPNTDIWLGGPEVSYNIETGLLKEDYIDGILIGEGEETFLELASYYIEEKRQLEQILGIAYKDRIQVKKERKITQENQIKQKNKVKQEIEIKQENKRTEKIEIKQEIETKQETEQEQENEIKITKCRPQLDLNKIPFPYEELTYFENRIIYYESSRGCPYSCSYCLSSIEKGIRLRHVDLVKKELQFFLDHNVPQVKFIDRTFNCNHQHAMAIWHFIKEQDKGETNFHFEISADLLREEELEFLNTLRPGLIQLEIGVQSTNSDTIKAIHRKMDLEKLSYAVSRIQEGNNIHQHLDLIAGLPYEDYHSFRQSFQDVYQMKPNQLQLGFLKVLKGSNMYAEANRHSIVYKSTAPYEVLYTKWLPYNDVIRLKQVEEMVEVYYNSGQFTMSMLYIEHFYPYAFDLYQKLGVYYEEHGLNHVSHSRLSRYDILLKFCEKELPQEVDTIKEILVYDLYLRENIKSRPAYATDSSQYKDIYYKFYQKEEQLREYLPNYNGYQWKQIVRMTHLEYFSMDIEKAAKEGRRNECTNLALFDYDRRNPLDHQARVIVIPFLIKEERNELV